MMFLHYINDNILISRPSCLSVYQDEAKMRDLKKDNFGGVGTKPEKTDTTVVHISPAKFRFFNRPTIFLKRFWV